VSLSLRGKFFSAASAFSVANYKTTEIVFDGILWPDELIAFTRYSALREKGAMQEI